MPNFLLFHSKQISELAQALALLAAAGFFLWKLVAGYLFCNLSVQLGLTRIARYSGRDYLNVDIKLTKGDRSSLLLKRIQVSVKQGNAPLPSTDLESPIIPDGSRMIRLTPGESTHFSYICEVPSDSMCYVEVVIEGKSSWLTTGHWKASAHCVKLPADA